MGLKGVVQTTMELFPEGHWAAFAAAAITTAFGMAYISTLYALFRKHGDEPPDQEEVFDEVRKHFSAGPSPQAHSGLRR